MCVILALALLPSAGLAQSNSPAVEQQILLHITGTYPSASLVVAVEDQIQEWFERDANGLGEFGLDTSCCYRAEITTQPISLDPSCVNLSLFTFNGVSLTSASAALLRGCYDQAIAQGASIAVIESLTIDGQARSKPYVFLEFETPRLVLITRSNPHFPPSSWEGLATAILRGQAWLVLGGVNPPPPGPDAPIWTGHLSQNECSIFRSLGTPGLLGCSCSPSPLDDDEFALPTGQCSPFDTCFFGRCDGADIQCDSEGDCCFIAGVVGLCVGPPEQEDCIPLPNVCQFAPEGFACDPGLLSSVCTSGLCLQSINYVALGDSFTSGEGAPSPQGNKYDPLTDDDDNQCHRSVLAYPNLVRAPGAGRGLSSGTTIAQLEGVGGSTFGFAACSGAKSEHFNLPGPEGDPDNVPQLDHSDGSTNLVTLTIGGNDAYFGKILLHCFEEKSCHHKVPENFDTMGQTLENFLPNHIDDTVRGFVTDVLLALRSDVGAAEIVLAGYPQIVSGVSAEECGSPVRVTVPIGPITLTYELTQGEQDFIRRSTGRMNRMLRDVATNMGVTFVPIDFGSHEVCGASDPWINEVRWLVRREESFHPNAEGHRAYANALSEAIAGVQLP